MEIILLIVFALTRILDFLTTPIFNYRARNKRHFLPALKNDLLRVSATQLADQIRKKQISSEEITQIYIDRIKEVNPFINAVIEDRFNEAVKEARQVDSYVQTTSLSVEEVEKFKPLLGVPITIKESCSVKGMSLCVGLQSRIGYKADNDGEAVARLRSCGAIVLLVSATPELSMCTETFTHVNGYTNNPYDTTCTSAGSSGGEGALIGAGASLVGIGSDVLGSVRLPASFNGIFGHKPTPRTTPIKGHWPLSQDEKYYDYMVIGPLTRYATDLKLMMKVLCGNKLSAELKLDEPVDLSKLKVYLMEDVGFRLTEPKVSEDIKHVIKKSAKYLEKSCGSEIQDYKFNDFIKAQEICISSLFSLRDIPDAIKWENGNLFMELVKALIGKSKFTLHLMYSYLAIAIFKNCVGDYTEENQRLKTLVKEKLGDNGILLFPTFTGPAHKHNQVFFKNGNTYLALVNALGLAATSVPCGFEKNGMPIGIQVIAGPYQDRLCLAVAEELEIYFGGWIPPPEKK